MKKIHIVHLYPEEMNIYGDTGNRLILEKRLEWRGFAYKTSLIGIGQDIPNEADIIIGGGGQDASQAKVYQDLLTKASTLKALHDKGVVMLMICGMYQLFGAYFLTDQGKRLKGIHILDIETRAGSSRNIGNITVRFENMVLSGFENHSGRTYLGKNTQAFGQVLSGVGNNGDTSEGARSNNVFGTYMHGPILSKNMDFADYLLNIALTRHNNEAKLIPLDDTYALKAREEALKRPR